MSAIQAGREGRVLLKEKVLTFRAVAWLRAVGKRRWNVVSEAECNRMQSVMD